MSIFKQSFPNFVKKQFETREKVLASGINPNTGESISGGRSKEFFAYSLSKQCTIRMVSGVNLRSKGAKNDFLEFVPGHPIAGLEKSGPEFGFSKLFDNI